MVAALQRRRQAGFAQCGGPHILSFVCEVATRAQRKYTRLRSCRITFIYSLRGRRRELNLIQLLGSAVQAAPCRAIARPFCRSVHADPPRGSHSVCGVRRWLCFRERCRPEAPRSVFLIHILEQISIGNPFFGVMVTPTSGRAKPGKASLGSYCWASWASSNAPSMSAI